MSDRLADDAREVCDLALREAMRLGYNYIHSEHLVLAMIKQEDSVLVQALDGCDVEPSVLRESMIQVLRQRLQDAMPPRTDVRRG